MATTKILRKVKARVDKVIDYVINPEKCLYTDDENVTHYLASGINCAVPSAYIEFENTRQQFCKADGNLAYHIEQSFKEGEISPLEAHAIGVELANTLWGDRFQIVVGTHTDQKNIHNHFTLNSVSFVDGKKFNDCYKTLKERMDTNDRICKEHGLSIIENPQYQGKTYAEWIIEKNGGMTWKKLIRDDIDDAIKQALTFSQLATVLLDKGYKLKNGAHLAVLPPGKEKYVRLYKLGKGYTEEDITARLLGQTKIEFHKYTKKVVNQHYKTHSYYRQLLQCRRGGFRGLYISYLYRLKEVNKSPSAQHYPFPMKEDVLKMKQYSYDLRLLSREKIDDTYELENYKEVISEEKKGILTKRQDLRISLRTMDNAEEMLATKVEIKKMNQQLSRICVDLKSCESIELKSAQIKLNFTNYNQEMKEGKKDGSRKRSSRTSNKTSNRRRSQNT